MSKRYCHDVDGYLVVDKPSGISSNALLQKVRRLLGAKKAGHGGTLDPLASGLMLLAFGRATKVLSFMLADQKSYRVGFQLGVATATGDSTGEITRRCESALCQDEVEAACASFLGVVQQVPPMYSALKHQGVPLYALARKGETIERRPRQVTIHSIKLVSFDGVTQGGVFEVVCSKGTYVRTLVEDLAQHLGVVAHVDALRRLGSGTIDLTQAHVLDDLQHRVNDHGREELVAQLRPCEELVAHYPAFWCSQAQILALRHGVKSSPVIVDQASSWLRLLDERGGCVALAWANDGYRIETLRWFREVLS